MVYNYSNSLVDMLWQIVPGDHYATWTLTNALSSLVSPVLAKLRPWSYLCSTWRLSLVIPESFIWPNTKFFNPTSFWKLLATLKPDSMTTRQDLENSWKCHLTSRVTPLALISPTVSSGACFVIFESPYHSIFLTDLLEKSRVTSKLHPRRERNFHIFYQLLAGADIQLLSK